MKKFETISSLCLTIETENIDTDRIVPARFLKITKRDGFGKYLFHDWSSFRGLTHKAKKILVAGNNFGCGSSREHAVWAILDFGFKVVISSSFGDIFYNNSLKNGLLPIVLKPTELKRLFQVIGKEPQTQVTVDLGKQKLYFNNYKFSFPIDSFRKTCLLKGVGELGYILSFENKIKDFEKTHQIFISV